MRYPTRLRLTYSFRRFIHRLNSAVFSPRGLIVVLLVFAALFVTTIAIADITAPGNPIVGVAATSGSSTSTLTTIGTAPGANNSPAQEQASNAIDDNTVTKFLNFQETNCGFIVTPQPAGSLVTGFQIRSANDAPERDPLTVTLEGTDDLNATTTLNSTWTQIYSGVSGLAVDPGRTSLGAQINFTNVNSFKSYRFLVASVRNGATANSTQLTELELIGFSLSPANVSGTKTVSGTFSPGNIITYTVVLSNSGTSTQLDNPGNEFADVLPAGLTLVSASATSGTAVSSIATNTATWNGTIPAGSSVTININAQINSDTVGSTISNQGTVFFDADGNGTNESSSATDDPTTEDEGDPTSFTVCGSNLIVTTTADSGPGSLRDAILGACPTATITFAPALTSGGPATIALTTGELLIDKNLTITGPGANLLSIARNTALETAQFRIFQISSGSTVNISGVTITNGQTAPGAEDSDNGSGGVGGGIFNNPGATLNLKNVTIKGNQTGAGNSAGGIGGSGGGLANFGTLNIVNSTISSNRTGNGGAGISGAGKGGEGGGISNGGTMTIVNSTISGNQTGAGGNSAATATQGGDGGGIANAGTLTVINSTISANQTGAGGAGATGGDGGGIIAGERSNTTLKNSIVAGNFVAAGGSSGIDLSGNFDSDLSLIGSTAGAIITGANNILNQSANISPLANHGGPTETMLPLPGSPAINAGDDGTSLPQDTLDADGDTITAETLPVDQRGFSRVVDAKFDLGAVETNYLITATGGSAQSAVINTAFALPLKATVKESGVNQSGISVTFTPPASGASGSFSGPTTVNTDGSGVATSPTFTANNIGGIYNVVASLAGGTQIANFALTNLPGNQTITFNPNPLPNKTFGDADFDVNATASSGLTVTFTPTGNCTMSGNTVHLTGAGSCTITASQAGNASFNPAPNVVRSFSIAKADQTINFGPLPEKHTGDPDFTVNATSTSGLPVTFTVTGQCTISGNTVHITGIGSCTVTAAQAGDANFNAAPSVAQSFAITHAVQISLSQSNYNVSESTGFVTITVNRSGDLSSAVSVDYTTSDTGSSNDCGTLNSGLASARCDFGLTLGTMQFGPNETQKTFVIPVTQDSYTEGPEIFGVNLSNVTGINAGLAAPSSATVTINDSPGAAPNAIDDTATFVRQHYRDFLNRDADPAGLAFWVNEIDNCTPKPQCTEVKQINVSAAFFLSIEFQSTGILVRSFYVAALNRPATDGMPEFTEFIRDTQALQRGVIVDPNSSEWQVILNNNIEAFMKDFATRPEFVGLYPTTDTPTQYVDKLYLHAQITPSAGERMKALSEFGTALTASDPGARGRALLDVTQNTEFQTRELNRAFVQMQYFGYLRRNPNDAPDSDFSGYNFWLNKLNQFGNFVDAEMVKAFITSAEYRHRFGP